MVIAIGQGTWDLAVPKGWGGGSRIVLYAWWTPGDDELGERPSGLAQADSGEVACIEPDSTVGPAKA